MKKRRIEEVGGEGKERKQREYRVRSIQQKFRPIQPGNVVHLKKWTSFFETFPVGLNRSIEFWTEISGNFGLMDRAHNSLTAFSHPLPHHFLFQPRFNICGSRILRLGLVKTRFFS